MKLETENEDVLIIYMLKKGDCVAMSKEEVKKSNKNYGWMIFRTGINDEYIKKLVNIFKKQMV